MLSISHRGSGNEIHDSETLLKRKLKMKASCLRCHIAYPYLAEVEDIEEPMLIDAIAEASRVASIAPILPGKHTSSKQHERSEVRASLQVVNRPRCIVHSVV